MTRLKYVLLVFYVHICVYCICEDRILFDVDSTEEEKSRFHENSECTINGTHKGTCQNMRNCSAAVVGLRDGIRPVMCSFEGTEPIVCCESKIGSIIEIKEPLVKETGISGRMCALWERQLCNTDTDYSWHIIGGGEKALAQQFPYMAAIGYGNLLNVRWSCGGSLISERYVLSAAHCTNSFNGKARWARLGDLNIKSNDDNARPMNFMIIQHIDHPDYKLSLLYNDIALYKLDRDVQFNDYIKPVCLHTSHETPSGYGIATGWGRLGNAHPLSEHLMTVPLPFLRPRNCTSLIHRSSLLPRGIDEKTMVCAGEKEGVKDTCQGDSGGPLAIKGEGCMYSQVGITSFGGLCGIADSPGIYTRVAHFVPWIESIVWS